MWQSVEEQNSGLFSGFSGFAEPKEVMIYHTPNSFRVDAELCRNANCGVRHIYPIDIVFSVHKKGPLRWWSSCFAPGVAGVHYRDKKNAAEDEITVQKRHLSELERHHAADAMFGHTREHCWSAMQKRMTEYGTYLTEKGLDRLKDTIKERLRTSSDAPLENTVDNFCRVFAHLMFDRAYFEAAMANGFEAFPGDSVPYPPLTPAGLTDVAREQWAVDYWTLVAYAQEQERTSNSLKKGAAKKKAPLRDALVDKTPSTPRKASTAACDAPKPPHPLRKANQELYATNKKLADENSSADAKLQRTKAILSALTSKIETKVEASQGPGGLTHRLSAAVTSLLQHAAKDNTMQEDVIQPEVALLTEQLKMLDQSNGRLQNELAELRKQMVAARQKKKAA